MADRSQVQATLIESGTVNKNQSLINLAVFGSDGVARPIPKRAAAQANSAAVDVAGLVTDFNALLVKLRAAGIIAP